ncbi:unnamed protein product [Moneuplotes crassus]|uniref:RING-type domain-containing protein n=1 Tax=Euplotes crassus TaxID=5936 RepID=A0AAD1UF71_EUPCR|nr:unnamed protein product [Moneuplotes crassus]
MSCDLTKGEMFAVIYAHFMGAAFQALMVLGVVVCYSYCGNDGEGYARFSKSFGSNISHDMIDDNQEIMLNPERNLIDPEEMTIWSKFGYEILFMAANLSYYIAVFVLIFTATKTDFEDTWTCKPVGLFIYIISFIVINRDFCIIMYRMLEYGYYPPVHIPIFFYLFIICLLANDISIFGCMVILSNFKRIRELEDWKHNFIAIVLNHFFQILCIIGSFFIKPYFEFFTNNIFTVVLQNLFWLSLVLYTFIRQRRIHETKDGLKSWFEWAATLCISLHLTFTANYFYIFESGYHSTAVKVVLVVVFALIHISLISTYMIHQSYFLGSYVPYFNRYWSNELVSIHKVLVNNHLENKDNPQCQYCTNLLSEPCLEYLSEEERSKKSYKIFKKHPSTCIQTNCNQVLHPQCLQKVLPFNKNCPFCNNRLVPFVKIKNVYINVCR